MRWEGGQRTGIRVGKARLQIRETAKTRGRKRNKSGGGTSIEVDIGMQMGSEANKKREIHLQREEKGERKKRQG